MGSCPQTNFRLSNFLETKGTRVRSPARLPACLRGLRAHCATVRRASRGGGQRGAAPCSGAPKVLCSLRVSSGEHTAHLPSWNPSSDPHSSPTETRKPTDRSSKALCRSDVLVLLEERSLIVLTGRTWWRN